MLTDEDGEEQGTAASPLAYGLAILGVAIASLIGLPFRGTTDPDNLTMFYLTATVFVALRLGLGPAILASVLSVLAFNFLFIPPYYHFTAFNPASYLTFVILFLTSLAAAGVSARLVGGAAAARREQAETRFLLGLSRDLTAARTLGEIHITAIRYLSSRLSAEISLHVLAGDHTERLWQGGEKRKADIIAGTDAGAAALLQSGPVLLLPLDVATTRLGFLVVEAKAPGAIGPAARMRLETVAALIAGAAIRVREAEETARARAESENERLRNVLLSSLSHDLRTPLTVLGGTVANLMKLRRKMPREAMDEITDLSRQISRLQTFTANLLKIAAIASGGLKLNREANVVQEIIGSALGRLAERKGQRVIRTTVAGQIPLVDIDAALVEQVIVNLLDNAIAQTTEDAVIQIVIERAADFARVSVIDDGPGLPPGEEKRVFERFRTGAGTADRRRGGGTGLGLAICRGVIEAHGGSIGAANNTPAPGATFTFTLPLFGEQEAA